MYELFMYIMNVFAFAGVFIFTFGILSGIMYLVWKVSEKKID